MKRWTGWVLVGVVAMAVMVTGCSKEKGRAKTIAKAFFRDLIDDDYTSATQFVDDDDVTSLYENWPDMREKVQGADDWSIDVELAKSKKKGKAVCTVEFKDGKEKKEVAVAVDLKMSGGDWYVTVAPNPDARKPKKKEEPKAEAKEDAAAADVKDPAAKPEEKAGADVKADAKADVKADAKPAEEPEKKAEEKKDEKPAEAAKPAGDVPAENK